MSQTDAGNGSAPRSLLRGRYLINAPLPRLAFRAIDAVLDRFPSTNGTSHHPPAAPRRLLLALGGHLGDAIIATAAIAHARELLPDAEIGVLAASWSLAALDGNPAISRIHVVDHWKVNRVAQTATEKARRYVATWRRAVAEIRDVRYDLAIDLHPYYPNSAALLKVARIPVRIGYTSAGLGALYTHPVVFADEPIHQAEQHARLIALALGMPAPIRAPRALHYQLAAIGDEVRKRVSEKLAAAGVAPTGYVLAHMSAATPQREWVREKWRATIEHLLAEGHQVVCTGLAGHEEAVVAEITRGLSGCVNLAGRFTWPELVAAVASAKLVLSVDTVVAHVAGAYDLPAVTLMATMARPEHWRPLNAHGSALSNPMPCAPCFAREGCSHMSCVRGIAVDDVIRAVEARLT